MQQQQSNNNNNNNNKCNNNNKTITKIKETNKVCFACSAAIDCAT
jgi:hypothetical protein